MPDFTLLPELTLLQQRAGIYGVDGGERFERL